MTKKPHERSNKKARESGEWNRFPEEPIMSRRLKLDRQAKGMPKEPSGVRSKPRGAPRTSEPGCGSVFHATPPEISDL